MTSKEMNKLTQSPCTVSYIIFCKACLQISALNLTALVFHTMGISYFIP